MLHLPEPGSQIQCRKNRVGSSNVTNALSNLFHTVFVNVRVVIQFAEILDYVQTLAFFLWNTKQG
jgi:hypothetical protein